MNRMTITNFLKKHPTLAAFSGLAGFLICVGLSSYELFISQGTKRIPILIYVLWLLGLRSLAHSSYKKSIITIANLSIIGMALALLVIHGFEILPFAYLVIFSLHLVYLYLPKKWQDALSSHANIKR